MMYKEKIQPRVLGCDLGDIIADLDYISADYWSSGDSTPEVPDALNSLRRLIELFNGSVYIISQVDKQNIPKTNSWLQAHDFFDRTNIKPANLIYCDKNEDKAGICTKLGITDFIDDRVSILTTLKDVKYIYLFTTEHEELPNKEIAKNLNMVSSWDELVKLIEDKFF